MIKIENYEVMGWEHVIRGMRNPMNSWEKSDSYDAVDCKKCGKVERDGICRKEDRDCTGFECYAVGPNDHELMMKLRNAGTDHRKFMRMITVYVDITAPLYWWKEFDTYKVGTVANSCSTMHKLTDKAFTIEDFSHEHLDCDARACLEDTINLLNEYRSIFVNWDKLTDNTKNAHRLLEKKDAWYQMIQLLPSSYNQKRTVQLNYEVLANIYKSRRNHKLDEWSVDFCGWIEKLPYSELITGKDEEVEIVTDSNGNEVCRITKPDKEAVLERYNRMVAEGDLDVEVYRCDDFSDPLLAAHTIVATVLDDHNQFTEDEKWILRNYITSTGVTTVKFFSDRFKEEKDEVN